MHNKREVKHVLTKLVLVPMKLKYFTPSIKLFNTYGVISNKIKIKLLWYNTYNQQSDKTDTMKLLPPSVTMCFSGDNFLLSLCALLNSDPVCSFMVQKLV